jgi:hypothetical protein
MKINLLKLCLIALLLVTGASLAVAQVTLSLPDTAVANGRTVTVPIKVTGFYHVGSYSLIVGFDKTVLTYGGLSGQTSFGIFNSTSVTNANANGAVSISWFNVSPALNFGTGTLLSLTFTLSSGTSALTWTSTTPSSVTDSLATNIPATFTNGRISGPPSTITLSSPANAATGVSVTPTLTWVASPAAKTYRLQFGTSQTFATTLVDDATLTTASKVLSTLSSNTTYYWRVSATNAAGTSAYSSTFSFTTGIAGPAAPVLTAPANSATGQASSLTLTWGASATATNYRVQVSTSSSFTTTFLDQSNVTGTSQALTGLASSTTYYWRVSATNAGGTSAYSTTFSFTTVVVPPSAPTLSAPANGATNQPLAQTLSWDASAGATSYRVQLSTSATFATTLVNDSTLTGTSRAVGPLTNNTTYYWRVNAKNAAGTSAFSAASSFTTVVAPPSAPTLASPANNATNVQLTTTLSWNAATGATGYHLQVSTLSSFTSTVVDDSTLTTTSRSVTSLALNTTYYWRVHAMNAGGSSAYSAARNFKTTPTTAVEKLDGSIPTDYALSQNYPNPFNPTTTIQYQIPSSDVVTLRVYDVLGKQVFELVNQYQTAGSYMVKMNAQMLPSGMYLYELRSGSFVQTKGMILEK